MFVHNFKYALKTLFKNKILIFWTFAFPIILGTLFNMAFSNIEKSEKLDIINIAIVENDEFKNNEVFKESFKILSDGNSEERLFNTRYVTIEEAKELLENDEISGYLIIEDKPKVVVTTSGINETILQHVVEEISQTQYITENVVTEKMEEKIKSATIEMQNMENYNLWYSEIYEEVEQILKQDNVNIENISNSNLSYTMIEFYTLIAMTCLYGGILGMVAINQNLANMSNTGKRVAVSPISKGKLIFSSVLASYMTQLIGVVLLFIYTIFALKVDYGDNLLLIIILTLVGCLAGLSIRSSNSYSV